MLLPRHPVPALSVPTLAHGAFDLATDGAAHFTLVVFYRGLHCPICLKYLLELGRLQPEFEKRGVKVVALSSDGRERAQAMVDKLHAPALRMGSTSAWPRRANGVCTSAPRAARPRSASRSQRCSRSPASSLSAPTARCTTAPCRRCRSRARTSMSCWPRWTSHWRRTTRRAVSTRERCRLHCTRSRTRDDEDGAPCSSHCMPLWRRPALPCRRVRVVRVVRPVHQCGPVPVRWLRR
jgi:AhpC/TSA family